MLRDLPPFRVSESESMASIDTEYSERNYEDPLDDVFGSESASPATTGHDDPSDLLHAPNGHSGSNNERSDIPRLRSTHVTNGYRNGIAESKAQYVQEGFDEGYSLGAVLGMKAGWCLGVLEGILRAMQTAANHPLSATPAQSEHISRSSTRLEEVRTALSQARKDLAMQMLFRHEYFGADGIWTYDIPGHDGEDQITFQEVAVAHPLIVKWIDRVRQMAAGLKLNLYITPTGRDIEVDGVEDGAASGQASNSFTSREP